MSDEVATSDDEPPQRRRHLSDTEDDDDVLSTSQLSYGEVERASSSLFKKSKKRRNPNSTSFKQHPNVFTVSYIFLCDLYNLLFSLATTSTYLLIHFKFQVFVQS